MMRGVPRALHADLLIVFLHVAEIDVFHEVLGVRVELEYPTDDLNAFAHR